MTIEVTPDGTGASYVVGFEGEYTVADLGRFIEQLDSDVEVERVELTLSPTDRLSLRVPVPGTELAADEVPPPIETSARVQLDSVPYHVLTVLEESDEPLRTEEVHEALDDLDLSQNAIASRLWNLYKRGLVDKEPFAEDRRQKVYTLTGRGVYALEQARERAE